MKKPRSHKTRDIIPQFSFCKLTLIRLAEAAHMSLGRNIILQLCIGETVLFASPGVIREGTDGPHCARHFDWSSRSYEAINQNVVLLKPTKDAIADPYVGQYRSRIPPQYVQIIDTDHG